MPKLSRPIQYVPKSTLEGLGGASDHGGLTGLGDDDHTQYHNDTRGDARYYTQTLLNAGQLDTRYYTEAEVDALNLTDFGATAHRTFYSDGSGNVIELAHGTSTQVLTSNGASSAPSWQAAGGGLTYFQDDTDHGEILYSTFVAFETDSLGVVINGVDTDTQPRINFLDDDGGTQVGNIRATSGGFTVDNRRTSGHLLLRAVNSSVSVVELLNGDPDGSTQIFYAGQSVHSLSTASYGVDVQSDGTASANPAVAFFNNTTRTGFFQIGTSAGQVRWNSEVHGALMEINGEDTGGTLRAVWDGDPDGASKMYYAGTAELETISGSIKFGTHTAIGAETITGYITIQDSGGTSRKIAVVS